MSSPQSNPEQLLDAVARGCTDSLAALYDSLGAALFGIAVGVTRNHAEAEEVLQDAFVAIWKKADHYDPALGKATTWMIHLTRNLAIDRVRKRQRQAKLVERAAAEPAPAPAVPNPLSPLIAHETASRVREAVARLPGDQRRVLELAFLDGLTQSEIAEHLSLPIGTVKSRIRRALERVRRMGSELEDDLP